MAERSLAVSVALLSVIWVARRVDSWPQSSSGQYDAQALRDDERFRIMHIEHEQLRERFIKAVVDNASGPELQELLDGAHSAGLRVDLANSVIVDGMARKTMLFCAAANRSPAAAAVLLGADANVTAGRHDEGTTPMHLAAGWLHSERVVDVLLGARDRAGVAASLRAKPTSGGLREHTPVWWAHYYGHSRTHRRLVRWMRDAAGGGEYDAEADAFVLVGDDV